MMMRWTQASRNWTDDHSLRFLFLITQMSRCTGVQVDNECILSTYSKQVGTSINISHLNAVHIVCSFLFLFCIQTLCLLLDCLLTSENVPTDSPREVYETYFVFACIWAFGGATYQDQVQLLPFL